jgi:hypothetical protein
MSPRSKQDFYGESQDFDKSWEEISMDMKHLKNELNKYIGEDPLVKQEDKQRFYDWFHKENENKKQKRSRKWLISIGVSLAILFSAGVATAYIPMVNKIVSMVSPQTALFLQPIQKSDVHNGIQMETVAAINDEEMVVLYVTLKDLKKNRIDSTLDLYDFSLNGAMMFNSRLVDYDESTGTATLRIQANGGKKLNNNKVRFSIDSFLSHKKTHDFIEHDIFSRIGRSPKTMKLDMDNISGGGGHLFRSLNSKGTIEALSPEPSKTDFIETAFMEVTNIGLIEDRLHIQVRWKGGYVDSHGRFTFKDNSGNEVHSSSVSFAINNNNEPTYGSEYTEYIFNLDEVKNAEYELHGEFVTSGLYEEGNWSTTFKLESVDDSSIEKSIGKDFGSWKSKKLIVSPLGVTIYGSGSYGKGSKPKVEVKMENDEIIKLGSSKAVNKKNHVKVKFESELPLTISKIEAIVVNGSEVHIE